MIEPTAEPYSIQRIKSDLKKVENLGELLTQMAIPVDFKMIETFQKMQELAGSREFLPIYSQVNYLISKLKWAREGIFDSGYIIPWMSLYSHVGMNNQLASIASYYGNSSFSSTEKSPLIKTPLNPFGCGCRPVELDRDELAQIQRNGSRYVPNSSYRTPPSGLPAAPSVPSSTSTSAPSLPLKKGTLKQMVLAPTKQGLQIVAPVMPSSSSSGGGGSGGSSRRKTGEFTEPKPKRRTSTKLVVKPTEFREPPCTIPSSTTTTTTTSEPLPSPAVAPAADCQ